MSAASRAGDLDDANAFDEVYDAWFDPVCRWARALGCPSAEIEDVAQEVFLVVRRLLPRFDGANLPGWLYQITRGKVRDHRRSPWWRGRRATVDAALVSHDPDPPGAALEQTERRRVLDSLLAAMTERRRAVFVLFEIEGCSGQEIAALEGIPLKTVWTRLHHARRDFFRLLARHHHQEKQP